ncbi:hypothetical protein TNCV_3211871 [Trichonephila clavipes]|uniref:Uncharacterized protein n=1 Tax=Trichonephila clavipes TaxID=2585209 RepID=A0A8X6S2Z5_TRICX|nr:hypothetical protein TNCV_3211871 [Trichonephila clavipes]
MGKKTEYAKESRTLEHLMTFLRLEVKGEEIMQLAKSSFKTPIRKRYPPTERVNKPPELMTASALVGSEKASDKNINNVFFARNTSQ